MIHEDVALANLREGFEQMNLPFDMENVDMNGERIVLMTDVNGYSFEVGFSKPRQSYFFKMMDGRMKEATTIEMFVDFFSTYTRLQTDFLPKARDAANAFSVVADRAYKFSKVTGNKSTGYKALFADGLYSLTVSEENDVYKVQSDDKKYEYYFVDGVIHMQYTWDSYLDRVDMENTESTVEAEADERTFEIKLRRDEEYACFTPVFNRDVKNGVSLKVSGGEYLEIGNPFSLDEIIDAYNGKDSDEFKTDSPVEVVDDNKIYVKEGTGVVPEYEEDPVVVQRVKSEEEPVEALESTEVVQAEVHETEALSEEENQCETELESTEEIGTEEESELISEIGTEGSAESGEIAEEEPELVSEIGTCTEEEPDETASEAEIHAEDELPDGDYQSEEEDESVSVSIGEEEPDIASEHQSQDTSLQSEVHIGADEIVEFEEETQAKEPEKVERSACNMSDSTISVSKVTQNDEVLYLQFTWNNVCYDMPLEIAEKFGIPLRRIRNTQALENYNGVSMTAAEFESGTFARDVAENETLQNDIISAFFSGR